MHHVHAPPDHLRPYTARLQPSRLVRPLVLFRAFLLTNGQSVLPIRISPHLLGVACTIYTGFSRSSFANCTVSSSYALESSLVPYVSHCLGADAIQFITSTKDYKDTNKDATNTTNAIATAPAP